MALRLYVVPKVLDVDTYKPKYFGDGTVAAQWAGLDYDDIYFVAADLSGTDHTTVAGQADAVALPANLNNVLTAGQVTTVQNKLEAAGLPANWVDTSFTWKEVLRVVVGIILLVQRFKGRNDGGKLLGGGLTLDSTVGDLSSNARQRVQDAAVDLGLDVQGITLGSTLRSVLRNFGGQFTKIPVRIGAFTL